jgi:hypothetical protein
MPWHACWAIFLMTRPTPLFFFLLVLEKIDKANHYTQLSLLFE